MEFINLKQAGGVGGGHVVDVKYCILNVVVATDDDIVVVVIVDIVVSNGLKVLHKVLEVKTVVFIDVSRGQKVFKLVFMLVHKVLAQQSTAAVVIVVVVAAVIEVVVAYITGITYTSLLVTTASLCCLC